MRKSLLFLVMAAIYGCTCIGQIPTQYVYVDQDCNAELPDFTGMVVVADNCSIVTLLQLPAPGTIISTTTQVQLQATDSSGNQSTVNFDTVILDTIAPSIYYDSTLVAGGYTDKQVGEMYKVFYGWVQEKGDEWNRDAVGDSVEIVLPDTTLYYVQDSMIYFEMTIPILDYRADEGYWQNNELDLSAMFK